MDEEDALNGVEADVFIDLSDQTTPHTYLAKRARSTVQEAVGNRVAQVQFWHRLEDDLWMP